MRCEEVRLYVHAFHDSELTADKSVVIVEHLKGCDDCRAIYDAELRVRESAKSAYESTTLPETVRAKLLPRPRPKAWFRIAVALAAAGLLLTVGLVIVSQVGKQPPPSPVFDVALSLDRAPVPDAITLNTPDDGAARAQLASYVRDRGAQPCLHDLSKIGYVHRGGAVVRDLAPGVMVCWTLQETGNGHRLTHVNVPASLFSASELPPPGQTRLIERDGRTILLLTGSGFV